MSWQCKHTYIKVKITNKSVKKWLEDLKVAMIGEAEAGGVCL